MKKKFIFIAFAFIFFSTSAFANTQAFAEKMNLMISEENINYSKIGVEIDKLSKQISENKVSVEETVSYIKSLGQLRSKLSEIKDGLDEKATLIQRRIDSLGVIEEGAVEPKAITSQRKSFQKELSEVKSNIAETDLITTKISEIDNSVLNLRNKELRFNVLDKQAPLIYPKNLYSSSKMTLVFLYDLIKAPFSWYSSLDENVLKSVNTGIAPVLAIFSGIFFLVVFLNIYIRKKFGYKDSIENPDYKTRFIAALALSIAYGLIPLTVLGAFIFWIQSTPFLLDSFFGLTLNSLAFCLLFISFSQTIVRVLFAPSNSSWRLIEVNDLRAKKIGKPLLFSIISIMSVSFFLYVAKEAKYSAEVLNLIGVISSGVKSFSIGLIAFCTLSSLKGGDEEEEELSVGTKTTILVSISMFATFALSFAGYVSLSIYILNKLIGSSLIILGFYIIQKIISELIEYIVFLNFWRVKLYIHRGLLKKVSFFLNFIAIILIFFCAFFVILGFWGASVDLLFVSIKRFLNGFYIGDVKISIIAICFGVFVFFASFAAFKALRNSLSTGLLSKAGIDEGARNSLSSGIGFLGIIISLLFAIAVAGGSLKSLTLIAGAMSFGVGLGLQNIVSNCVSGIIILFERPIKVGDWVQIDGEEGIVKQISIRATKIQTFDKANVIIPNGNILSGNVINLTHGSKQGRVRIAVSVAYGTDISLLKKALIEAAESNSLVLKTPAPSVSFDNLAEYGMDFELRCFVANILNGATVKTEVRESILEKFIEYDIKIPLPQSVVHTKTASVEHGKDPSINV